MRQFIILSLLVTTLGLLMYVSYYVVTKNTNKKQATATTTLEELSSETNEASTSAETLAPKEVPPSHGVKQVSLFSVAAEPYYTKTPSNPVLSKITLFSNGDIAYAIHNPSDNKDTVFLNGKEVRVVDRIFSLKEVGGKLAFLSYSSSTMKNILTYEDKDYSDIVYKAPLYENPDAIDTAYMNIAGKLAYLTFDPATNQQRLTYNGVSITTGDRITYNSVDDKLAYIVYSKKTDQETLFYDGNQIAIADSFPLDRIKGLQGKLLYIAHSNATKKDTLIFDNKKFGEGTLIYNPKIIEGKPIYTVSNDPPSRSFVMHGDEKLATGSGIFSYKEIGGKLAYVYSESEPRSDGHYEFVLMHNGKKIASAVTFNEIEDVDGKILDLRRRTTSDKNINIYYDNVFLRQEYMPAGETFRKTAGILSYIAITTKDINGESVPSSSFIYDGKPVVNTKYMADLRYRVSTSSPYYFYAMLNEKTASTTIAVYKVE